MSFLTDSLYAMTTYIRFSNHHNDDDDDGDGEVMSAATIRNGPKFE